MRYRLYGLRSTINLDLTRHRLLNQPKPPGDGALCRFAQIVQTLVGTEPYTKLNNWYKQCRAPSPSGFVQFV